MRPPCWQNGITVSTKDGKEIGESKAAAFGAVAQVSPPPPSSLSISHPAHASWAGPLRAGAVRHYPQRAGYATGVTHPSLEP
jgi:hypothetical protein